MIFLIFTVSRAQAEKAVTRLEPGVNQQLLQFQSRFTPPRLIKMGDRVTMAYGYDYANFAFIEGDDGIIMIDTGFYTNRAAHALKDYRKSNKKPILAIIYTHVHYDHRGGSPVFLKEAKKDIPVYAPAGWKERLDYDLSEMRPLVVRRGMAQFGMLLPEGKEGTVGAGIGPVTRADGRSGFVVPTVTVTTPMEVTTGGVRLQMVPTPGDIESHMMVWLPDEKVLCTGDLLGGTLPYVATARFERDREARKFVLSLDRALKYHAEYVVPGHGRPLMGTEDVRDVLLANRDAAQFLDDQVTRYTVKGYSPDEIIDVLQLPPHLADHPDLQPHYHKLAWLIRGMYLKRAGWVNDIISLVRHTDSEEAKRLVSLLGGADKVTDCAAEAMGQQDYPWAARLAHYVLTVDPKNQRADEILTEALKGIAYTTKSANERNYILTMLKKVPWQKVFVATGRNARKMQPSKDLLQLMGFRFRAEDAMNLQMILGATIQNGKKTEDFTLEARRGILVVRDGRPEIADGRVRMARKTLLELAIGGISWQKALDDGAVTVTEGGDTVDQFVPLIEQGVVSARNVAAQTQKTAVEKKESVKGVVHTHESPRFSITYPESWSVETPEPGSLFTAKGGMFGIPKMNVLEEKKFDSPDALANDTIRIVKEKRGAKNCSVIYAKEIALSDGTQAFATMIKWDHPMIPNLYTAKIVAQKGDVIIGVSFTDDKKVSDADLQFIRSLNIQQ